MRLGVYAWNSWEGFLLEKLFPNALVVQGALDEEEDVLAEALADATHVLFHVNLSLTVRAPICRSALIRKLKQRGVEVLNEGVTDIRKRHLHEMLDRLRLPSARASKAGPPEQLLIVKTTENYGGRWERELTPQLRDELGISPPSTQIVSWSDYQVARRKDLDPATFDDPTLCVEHYVGGNSDRFLRVYRSGRAVVVVFARCDAWIKKVQGTSEDHNLLLSFEGLQDEPALPEPLRSAVFAFFNGFSLDFGALDIMEEDGRYYIVDVNDTPYAGEEQLDPVLVSHLVEGLANGYGGPRAIGA